MGGEEVCHVYEPIFHLYSQVFIMGQNVKFGLLFLEIAILTSPCSEIARQPQDKLSTSSFYRCEGKLLRVEPLESSPSFLKIR